MSDRSMAFISRVLKPALIGLLLLLNYFAIKNLLLVSADLIRGDTSADGLAPRPIIHPQRIPVRPITQARQAVGRVGSDFAQVYFPAQDIAHLQDAFNAAKTLDPWKRPSRYAPLVILACAATFCRLDFGYACLLHMLFQTLLFYGVLYWALSQLNIRKYFLFALLSINLCLFLTPVGLSWLERGQFSLCLAAGYTVLMLGLMKRQPAWIVAAAALSFIKWTSFPAIFVILAVYLLGSRSLKELKSNALLVGVFAVTTLLLLALPALFTKGAEPFVEGLIGQELTDVPKGISLLRYEPRLAVKLMPLALILLGYLNARSADTGPGWLIPYSAGVITIMLIYPTRAYEYGLPSVLGLLAPLLFWAESAGSARNILRVGLVFAFLVFVGAVSFSTRLFPSLYVLVEVYLAFSLVLMLSPSWLVLWQRLSSRLLLNPQEP